MTRKPYTDPAIEDMAQDAAEFFTYFEQARKRIVDRQTGQPGAANLNDSGHGSGPGGSPVEAALGLTLGDPSKDGNWTATPDHAAAILSTLDATVAELRKVMRRANAIVMANAPRPANPKQQAEVEVANDPLCEHCTRWVKPGNVERVHRTGDVAGNLDRKIGLCRWCYDFVRTNNRLPAKAEVERHDAMLPVRVSA